ncbi:jacalin-like lectin [Collimonas humicola]|uniref:jacalin-like lectin n=1 Tax=Collimonas humicola TaxID=2825886 RepID=UPI001B8B11B0
MCGFTRTEQHGGSGGGAFSTDLTETCQLVGINIRHGSGVDAIQAVWSTPSGSRTTGAWYGGDGGELSSINLAANEYITRVEGRSGSGVDQLKFITSTGAAYGPFGGGGGDPFLLTNLQDVRGLFGRSGSGLDAIGFFVPAKC